MRIDVRAVLNLLFRQRHIQSLGWPVRMEDREWRDQDLRPPSQPPVFYREVADSPRFIVEIEINLLFQALHPSRGSQDLSKKLHLLALPSLPS